MESVVAELDSLLARGLITQIVHQDHVDHIRNIQFVARADVGIIISEISPFVLEHLVPGGSAAAAFQKKGVVKEGDILLEIDTIPTASLSHQYV